MKRLLLLIYVLAGSATSLMGQVSISPETATADDEITITYDASLGTTGLVGVSRVFMHAGVILDGPDATNWEHVVGNWGDPDSPGEMTSLGDNKWQITITPRSYFAAAGLGANETVFRMGLVFREAGPCGGFGGNNSSCAEGKTSGNSDFFIDFSAFSIVFNSPVQDPLFVDLNETTTISIQGQEPSTITLFQDGNLVKTEVNSLSLNYDYTAVADGFTTFTATGTTAESDYTISTTLVVRQPVESLPRAAGIIDGINYHADPTRVTLSFLAPLKSSVIVSGDFNNWNIDPAFTMKKDGEHFWIELTDLTPGVEYGFQYLVDEELWVADPFAEMILDPKDSEISGSTYPNLKPYPSEAIRKEWYMNRVAVFQTGQDEYEWMHTDFIAPDKEDLVIYELLVRDFFGAGEENWSNMIDTLSYFESLGVNAIELMPVMDFNSEGSWGYDPNFMFAADKSYGHRNKLKEFVDAAHSRGIAVILDITMNHQDLPGTYVNMYFDFVNGKPAANSPWFNVSAKHPFNVFFDFNHESLYTQAYLDTINHYWLNEYHVDGYRFDLSKGFTQVNSGGDVGLWNSYDQSRVNLLTRMADNIWSHSPDAYIILEHFADNNEEKILANYGMMLWGNMTEAYNQIAMGYEEKSDISWGHYKKRAFNDPHLISYMESHDEERMAYKIATFGNAILDYSTRDFGKSMQRLKAAAAVFYTLPGPKMLWQFGELGYDISLEEGGRTSRKPVLWEYYENDQRSSVRSVVAALIKLKTTYPIFRTTDATVSEGNSLAKNIVLKGVPYKDNPTSSDEMNAVVAANFYLNINIQSIDFPHTGTWYNYFTGEEIEVSSLPHNVQLYPGEFVLYTDVRLELPDIITSRFESEIQQIDIYPNPSHSLIHVVSNRLGANNQVFLFNPIGQIARSISTSANNGTVTIDVSEMKPGVYFLTIPAADIRERIIIK